MFLLPWHLRSSLLPSYLQAFLASLCYCSLSIKSPWMKPFSSTTSNSLSFDKIWDKTSLLKKKKTLELQHHRDFLGPKTWDTEWGRIECLNFMFVWSWTKCLSSPHLSLKSGRVPFLVPCLKRILFRWANTFNVLETLSKSLALF